MTRALLLFALLASPAAAAERTIGTGSFERLRVEGPFQVRVVAGSPGARLSGDRDAIDSVEVRVEGGTMVVRGGVDAWGERRGAGGEAAPVAVTLSTSTLGSVVSLGGAAVAVTAMRGDRVDLAVTGAGAVTVDAAAATDLSALVVGTGTIAVAGRATRARLVVNGAGTIDAGKLEAGDATVRLEGAGGVRARARYTAQVASVGLGAVDVAGPAKCVVRGRPAGPVRCEGPRE